jgi:hypothetical protein
MLIASLLAAAAATAPVYLDCSFARESGGPFRVEVALDEPNQTATIALDTGRVVVRPAVFAPDRVRVPDEEMTWVVSRTDLSIRRTFSFMPATDQGEAGTCKIKPTPPKRAF